MTENYRLRERFKLSAAVFILLTQNDQVLFLLRQNTGWLDGHYSLPSGVKEPAETLPEAAIREVAEELGVAINLEDLLLVHLMHNFTTDEEWFGAFFQALNWHGEVTLLEPHKHSEFRWLALDEIPQNTNPYVKQALNHIKANQFYSEYGWGLADEHHSQITAQKGD